MLLLFKVVDLHKYLIVSYDSLGGYLAKLKQAIKSVLSF